MNKEITNLREKFNKFQIDAYNTIDKNLIDNLLKLVSEVGEFLEKPNLRLVGNVNGKSVTIAKNFNINTLSSTSLELPSSSSTKSKPPPPKSIKKIKNLINLNEEMKHHQLDSYSEMRYAMNLSFDNVPKLNCDNNKENSIHHQRIDKKPKKSKKIKSKVFQRPEIQYQYNPFDCKLMETNLGPIEFDIPGMKEIRFDTKPKILNQLSNQF